MKILSLDSATEACSVALYLDGEVFEQCEVVKNQHSAMLLDMVESAMRDNNVQLSELDAVVYDKGPGSFTGVRIGAGVAQGLALSANLPVLGVSSLEAMCSQCPDGFVLPAIDARMGQVYWSLAAKRGKQIDIIEDSRVDDPETVLDTLRERAGMERMTAIGTGWESYPVLKQTLSESLVIWSAEFSFPRASAVAARGALLFETQSANRVQPAMPEYVRNKVTN